MATLNKKKFNWTSFRVQDGKLLKYLKTGVEATQSVKEINGKRFEVHDGVSGKIVGFGIEEPEAMPAKLLEVVLQDGNEKFVISTIHQGYGYGYNLIQRLYTIMQQDGFSGTFEFWPYDFTSTSEQTGKEYRNRGFSVKNSEGKKMESFSFGDLPEIKLLKEKTKTKPAVWDDEERMEYLESKIEAIKKAIHESISSVQAEKTESLPQNDGSDYDELMEQIEQKGRLNDEDLRIAPDDVPF